MNGSAAQITSSLVALGDRYRGVAHNLANANTVGFKKRLSMFAEALAEQEKSAGVALSPESAAAAAAGGQIYETVAIDFTQGALTQTGRSLDVAIAGDGFFVVDSLQGPLYTRNGKFHANPAGQLVDSAGRVVQGEGGQITIPAGTSPAQIQISDDGQVSANGQSLAKLRVVQFQDRSVLSPAGQSCFQAGGAEPVEATDYSVRQGFFESSNVSVVEELVDLITVTRLYEANLKSINSQDDRLKQILQVAMQ